MKNFWNSLGLFRSRQVASGDRIDLDILECSGICRFSVCSLFWGFWNSLMGGCDWIRYSGYAIKFLTIFSIFFSKWLIFHTNRILAPADNRFCALIRYLISEQFPYFYPFWHSILIWHYYKPAISLTHKKYVSQIQLSFPHSTWRFQVNVLDDLVSH